MKDYDKMGPVDKYAACTVELYKLMELTSFYKEHNISISPQLTDELERRAMTVHDQAQVMVAANVNSL